MIYDIKIRCSGVSESTPGEIGEKLMQTLAESGLSVHSLSVLPLKCNCQSSWSEPACPIHGHPPTQK